MFKALRQLGLSINSSPETPTSDLCGLLGRSLAGKPHLTVIDSASVMTEMQSHLGRRKVGWGTVSGNLTSAMAFIGLTGAFVGTATARICNTTNFFTRQRRTGYVSAATAGSLVSFRGQSAMFAIGNGSGLGGFLFLLRFGCSDAASVSGARQWAGMTSNTGAPTNVDPATLTNSMGVGHGNADTNLKIFYGGSAAQTPIDLGANFPANTLSTDMYELILYADPWSGAVGYQVERLNTGHVASGVLTGTAGVALPANTTLLNPAFWRCNNATALAVALDITHMYIEDR